MEQTGDAWAGAVHAVPQSPQWVGLVCMSTHCPLQLVSGFWHVTAQVPLEQAWFWAQVLPQLPQLAGSLCRTTQLLLQFV